MIGDEAIPPEVLEEARAQAQAEARADWESTSLMDAIRITDLMLKAGAATPVALERYRARYRRASAEARAGATRLLVAQGGVEADLLEAGAYLAALPVPEQA